MLRNGYLGPVAMLGTYSWKLAGVLGRALGGDMSCLPSPGTGRTQLLGSMSPIQAKWVLASIASLCLGVPSPLLIRMLLALYGTIPVPLLEVICSAVTLWTPVTASSPGFSGIHSYVSYEMASSLRSRCIFSSFCVRAARGFR